MNEGCPQTWVLFPLGVAGAKPAQTDKNRSLGYLIIGAGWNPGLFQLESTSLVSHFVIGNSKRKHVHPRIIEFSSSNELEAPIQQIFSESALTDDVLQYPQSTYFGLDVADLSELISQSILDDGYLNSSDKISVRVRKIDGAILEGGGSELATSVGARLISVCSGVDLERPDALIRIICYPTPKGTRISWGLSTFHEPPRLGWGARSPTLRPYFRPIGVDVRIARALVHLASDGRRGGLLDPFSGTGGLLVEASMLGIPMLGIDTDPLMVKGAKENLEWIGPSPDHDCRLGDARDLKSVLNGKKPQSFRNRGSLSSQEFKIWNHEVVGLAFDPPYGRNAWLGGAGTGSELLFECLKSAAEITFSGSKAAFLHPIEPAAVNISSIHFPQDDSLAGQVLRNLASPLSKLGWCVQAGATMRVHNSLGRLAVLAIRE